MKKKLVYLGFVSVSVAIPLKVFLDKVDKETQQVYSQGQVYLAKVNIDKLRLLQEVRCDWMDLGTYFQQKASEKGFEPYVAAIIPRESAGDVYATGCDPCPIDPEAAMKRKNHPINSVWLRVVFDKGLNSYCLRQNATRENTCSVGFGLMQITSHTLSDEKYTGVVQPYALLDTKAPLVKGSKDYSAVNEEPKNSPYNPCTNIEVGLSILKDKYRACSKYGDDTVRRMACAVCYYNGRADYLVHIRETVIDRGQAGLLVRAGFIKDGLVEGLKNFVVKIAGFVNINIDRCSMI